MTSSGQTPRAHYTWYMLVQDRIEAGAASLAPREASARRQHLVAAVFIVFLSLTFFLTRYDWLRMAEPSLQAWYQMKAAGTLSNGDQYRIGVPFLAHFLEVHTHLEMRQSIPLIEAICFAGGLVCLYRLLIASPMFRNFSSARRLFAFGLFFAAAQLPILWIFPWERPETLPTMFFLAAASIVILESRIPLALACLLAVVLSFAQSLARTDAPAFLGAATLIAIPFVRFRRPRWATALLGLLCIFIAGVMQLYLRNRFPDIHPAQVMATVRLSENFNPFIAPIHVPVFLTAMLPFFFSLELVRRYRLRLDATDWLTLITALLYFPVYVLLGIVQEVRIYVPYLFLLSPAFAKVWVQFLSPPSSEAQSS